MKKAFFLSKPKHTRKQIMESYRLSANKHPVDQLGEDHFNVGAKLGLHHSESRQQLRQPMYKLKRSMR